MKIRMLIGAVCISTMLGCGAQRTDMSIAEPSVKPIVQEDAPSASLVVSERMPTSDEADGSFGETSGCMRLIGNDSVFEETAAQNAWKLFESGNYLEAAAKFKELGNNDSLSKLDKQKVWFLSALAENKVDAMQGTDSMKKAFEMDAPLRRSAAQYGTKFGYAAGRWQDVLNFTEDLRTSELYRTYRAIAMNQLGQYDAAVAEFERIEKFPRELRLEALSARAHAEAETSQLRSSLETYRRIYELDPNSSQGQMAAEAIMAEKERWPAGFRFPRTVEKPDKSKPAREIALDHFNAHRSEKAIAAYSKLLKEDKAAKKINYVCDDLYNIARSYVKLRSHSKSIPIFTEALSSCEKTELHVKILYSGAKAAWNAGQNDLAIAWYQEIIDKYPKHTYADDAYFYQAQILTGRGDLDKARDTLSRQIAAYPEGDMAKDAYWMLMADLYDRGLYKEAVKFVEDNINHAGESDLYSQGRLRYFQGRAYEKIGDIDSASASYLNVWERYPMSYYAMLSLGRMESLDAVQAEAWTKMYRHSVYRDTDAQNYCFHVIQNGREFAAAHELSQLGLYEDALAEIDLLMNSSNTRMAYEASIARAILLQKLGRYTDSARLAAGLLSPVEDMLKQRAVPWLLAYPKPWIELVSKAASPESDLFYTTYAVMREESYYNPKAESWANARGLMQVMLPTAQSTAAEIGMAKPGVQDLFKPETSIPIGAAYLGKLMKILVPHPMFVLPGYNAGQGNVGKWMSRFADLDVDVYVEKIPFKEARHYAKRVGTSLWRYRWLYDAQMPKTFDPAQKVSDLK